MSVHRNKAAKWAAWQTQLRAAAAPFIADPPGLRLWDFWVAMGAAIGVSAAATRARAIRVGLLEMAVTRPRRVLVCRCGRLYRERIAYATPSQDKCGYCGVRARNRARPA